MIKVIAINFGFAEDGQIGTVFFTTEHGFETEREACIDLARGLFQKFKEEEEYSAKWFYLRDEKGYVRDEKGHMIKSSRQPDLSEEAFIQYLVQIGLSTCDDFGGTEIENWWPWHSFKDILNFNKDEFCILDSRTLHEGRAESYLASLVFEEQHLKRIRECKKCGGIGFKCSFLRADGTHATIKDEHSVWHCCAPFWERVTKEIRQQAIEICDNKRKELGLK